MSWLQKASQNPRQSLKVVALLSCSDVVLLVGFLATSEASRAAERAPSHDHRENTESGVAQKQQRRR